jgi:zinc/manganese transport system ATP-binding protein
MTAIVEIRNLALGYPELTLFKHLSLDIQAGTTLAVLGANGSGKSTFVKMLLGLMDPLAGRVTWPAGRPQEVGYLAQLTEFDRRFPIRVRDLAAMGAWRGFGLWSGLGRAGRNRVAAALEEAGILDLADRSLHTLSGGQLQRALFARVILQDAPLILLDEPLRRLTKAPKRTSFRSSIAGVRKAGRSCLLCMTCPPFSITAAMHCFWEVAWQLRGRLTRF